MLGSLVGPHWSSRFSSWAAFPFVAVIEHTDFEPASTYGGRHVVYLSRYLPADDPFYSMDKKAAVDHAVQHLRRMFPALTEGSVQAAHVWRARYAQPLVERGDQRLIPICKRRSRTSTSPAWRRSIRRTAAPTTPFAKGARRRVYWRVCQATRKLALYADVTSTVEATNPPAFGSCRCGRRITRRRAPRPVAFALTDGSVRVSAFGLPRWN